MGRTFENGGSICHTTILDLFDIFKLEETSFHTNSVTASFGSYAYGLWNHAATLIKWEKFATPISVAEDTTNHIY